jgi:hypothetical protein
MNDEQTAADSRRATVYVLVSIDVSAAVDTIELIIPLSRLDSVRKWHG